MTTKKQQVLLKRDPAYERTTRVLFSNLDVSAWPNQVSIFMSRLECREMGDPDEITVTIEPGDQLNDPEQLEISSYRGPIGRQL